MVTTLHFVFVCLLITIPTSMSLRIRIRREAAEEKSPAAAGDSAFPQDAVELRALSMIIGIFGTEFSHLMPDVETKIVTYYTTELGAKKECKWTEPDHKKWTQKLEAVKLAVKNDSDLSLGLEQYQVRDNLTEPAKWTLGILEDMENFTLSIVEAEGTDIVVLKFAAYLREKMLLRRVKNPACVWNEEDHKKAEAAFVAIVEQLAKDTVGGVAKRLEMKVEDIMPEAEMENFKKELHELTDVFKALFEPFEED